MPDLTRFEILPFARGEEEAARLPERARLTVTCSPARGLDHSVEVAARLRARGHPITLHVAARMVRGPEHLDRVLATMAQADIDDAFVIGGDAASSQDHYASALELLQDLCRHPQRPRMVGVAGYPEGHPRIDSGILFEALMRKAELVNYIATQLCFHANAVLAWIHAVRQADVALPVVVGLPGVVDRGKLLEIALKVGVGPSLAFLRNQGGIGNLLRLSSNSAEGLHEALVPLLGDPALGIAGFHYFTFNRLSETWRWVQARLPRNFIDSETQNEVGAR